MSLPSTGAAVGAGAHPALPPLHPSRSGPALCVDPCGWRGNDQEQKHKRMQPCLWDLRGPYQAGKLGHPHPKQAVHSG